MFGILAGFTVHAQTNSATHPIAVSLCDLLSHPTEYDGKLIQTTGEIHLAFEEFTIADAECSDAWPWIWLYYGDKTQATMYAPFNNPQFSSEIHFIDDDQMKSFRDLIRKRRDRRPDGTDCYDRECNFYDVTTTITGHFLAIKKFLPTTGGGKIPNGYGHMGCCHALLIEQVLNLNAQRTDVPESGVYSCTKTSWHLSKAESEALVPKGSCTTYSSCKKREQPRFESIARHWQDQTSIEAGSINLFPETWYSSNLLLGYQIAQVDKSNLPLEIFRITCSLKN